MRKYLALVLLLLATPAFAGVGQLVLTWTDNSTNEDSFKVERKPGACAVPGAFTEIASLPANTATYTDAGLAPNVTNCYRVRAANAAGPSGYSNEADGTTLGVPAAPGGLTVQ